VSSSGDEVQPVHPDHRGDRLRSRNGEPRDPNEAGAQPPQRGHGQTQVWDVIKTLNILILRFGFQCSIQRRK